MSMVVSCFTLISKSRLHPIIYLLIVVSLACIFYYDYFHKHISEHVVVPKSDMKKIIPLDIEIEFSLMIVICDSCIMFVVYGMNYLEQ